MKKTLLNIVAITLMGLAFTACSDDKTASPTIVLTEVGHDDSHIAYTGSDMHLEADIEAEGLIKTIHVELLLEEGSGYRIAKEWADEKYIGKKNTEFHEHIDIPIDAPEGEYQLLFTVADREGNQSQATAHVVVMEPETEPTVE